MPGTAADHLGRRTARRSRASRASRRDISVGRGQTGRLQDRHHRAQLPDRHLPARLVRRRRRAASRDASAAGHAAAEPARVPDRRRPRASSTAATGPMSASWTVPADAVSGIYFAHARARGRRRPATSHVLVRRARRRRRARTCCSRPRTRPGRPTTSYGGNSLYTGVARRPRLTRSPTTARSRSAAPRPRTRSSTPSTRWSGGSSATATTSSYFTGVDSDRLGAELREHRRVPVRRPRRVLVRRASARTWRPRGTRACTWRSSAATRSSGRRAGRTNHRTLVSYKETHANAKIDPTGVVDRHLARPAPFNPGDGGRPENALTGTIFTVNAGTTRASRCPAADGTLRLWREHERRDLAPGGRDARPTARSATSGTRTSTTASRPPGLVRLSSTTGRTASSVLQDYGSHLGERHRRRTT